MSLPRMAVHRPVTTTMVFIAVVLLGAFSASRLSIDLIPEISFPSLTVSTSYSGVAPEEIESLITVPVEQAVSTLTGVTGMQSVSQEGSSRVTLRFDWGTDLDAAANEVRANVDRVRSRLPDEAGAPRVFQFNPSQFPIMTLGLGGDLDPADLRRLAAEEFTYYLERLEGVASVTVQGGGSREVRVVLDPMRLQGHGLTIDQVVQAIRAENLNVPAGRTRIGQAEFSLRTTGQFRTADELESVLVVNRESVQTRLRDIAEIEPISESDSVLVRVDGRPGVVLSVQKQSGANTVRVADAVLQTLEELQNRYPEITIRPLNDTSVFIRKAVENVVSAGIYGGLLAALILLVFLRSLRTTLIIAVSIPVSIVASFVLIERAGMTLNTMSLGGLALGIGMLLDNSIVVLENVYRHRKQGMPAEEAAIQGTAEMAPAITASTLTTLAVFLPVLFLTGTSGILFRELALMVAFSVGCSLVVALTLLPVMCCRLLRAVELERQGIFATLDQWFEAAFSGQEEGYSNLVRRAVRRPGLVFIIAVGIFLGSLALIPYLGSELLPSTDEGNIAIFISLPTGTRLEVTDEMVKRVEQLVRTQVPEVQAMDVRVGAGGFGGRGTHSGSVNVTLVPRTQRGRSTEEIVVALRSALAEIPGITARVRARGNFAERLASGSFGGGGGERITLNVQGHDLQLIRDAAEELQQLIGQVPGVTNVSINRDEAQPEFVIRVDRERAADFGLTTTQIANAVQAAVQGRVATQLRLDGREHAVRVVMAGADGLSPAQIEALPIPMGGGVFIPLRSVGSLAQQDSPEAIERLDQQRTVRLSASPEGQDLGSAVAAIRASIDQYELPEGITVFFGGEYEEQQRAFRELLLVLLLAVTLVYIVMASQFESLFDPLIVMFSVPFALVGVILTLVLTETSLTAQAFMGLIMLGGIVVNNAIVLVSYINLLRSQGVPLDEAIFRGTRTRLRPIVMTTGSTILGLIPLALEFGEGSEIQAPLARTVIGGLVVSTLVTLVLIPTLYRWAHRTFEKWRTSSDSRPGTPPTTAMALFTLITLAAVLCGGRAQAQAARVLPLLTLEAAIHQAIEANPTVREGRAKLEAAESQVREARATLRPQLTLDGSWERVEPLPGLTGDRRQGTAVSLSAQQVLATGPRLGRPLAAVDLAILDVEIARRELEDDIEVVTLSTLTAYVNALKAESALQTSRKAVQRAKATVAEVTTRLELGMAAALDLNQARTQNAAAKLAVQRAENRLQLARARLNQEIQAELFAEFQLEELPRQSRAWGSPENLVADPLQRAVNQIDRDVLQRAYDQRLEVVQARYQLRRAELNASARIGEGTPTFAASAGLERSEGSATLEWDSRERNTVLAVQGDLYQQGDDLRSGRGGPLDGTSTTNAQTNWSVSLDVSWPLYDGGAQREKFLREDIDLEQLQDAVVQQMRLVTLSVHDANFARLEAREEAALAAMERKLARERLHRAEKRVEGGVATPQDLLDAELSLLQAERALKEARWDAMLAEARFRRSVALPVWELRGATTP